MKARNPLETEPTESAGVPVPAEQAGESGAAEEASPWVEGAAGSAVRVAAPPPVRPVEIEKVMADPEIELARENQAAAANSVPGRAYRVLHATVFTVVMAFFISGAALCLWVFVHR
jgi:hypothetical protein